MLNPSRLAEKESKAKKRDFAKYVMLASAEEPLAKLRSRVPMSMVEA